MRLIEERLDGEKHFFELGDFVCGADDPLNTFLSDDAIEYDEEQYGSTYLIKGEEEGNIWAFFTIKANGIQIYQSLQDILISVPVVEIARIAVHYKIQRSGIGRKVFYNHIMPKVKAVAELIAVKAIIVFVEPDNYVGIAFYESLGFVKAAEEVQQKIAETFNEDCDLYVLGLNKE